MESKVPISLARVDAITEALRRAIEALDDAAITELSFACEIWGRTVSDGRQPLGVLNGRYDICLIEAAAPSPWILAVFDTIDRELVIVALLEDRKKPAREECGRLCASGLGETVDALVWY